MSSVVMKEGSVHRRDCYQVQNKTANDLTIESLHLVDLLSANGNLFLSLSLYSPSDKPFPVFVPCLRTSPLAVHFAS